MPALELTIFDGISENRKKLLEEYPIFVETGTFYGETIFKCEPLFKELHTIEIKRKFYKRARASYLGSKITFHLGDSAYKLSSICPTLTNNTIFFLDGHWSAGNTGRGEKDCPLYEEMTCIMRTFKHKAIVIIDDFRLFGTGPNTIHRRKIPNWEEVNKEQILKMAHSRLLNSYNLPSNLSPTDRLVLTLSDR